MRRTAQAPEVATSRTRLVFQSLDKRQSGRGLRPQGSEPRGALVVSSLYTRVVDQPRQEPWGETGRGGRMTDG